MTDKEKNEVANLSPIKCLPIMWKLLTGMIGEQLQKDLEKVEL